VLVGTLPNGKEANPIVTTFAEPRFGHVSFLSIIFADGAKMPAGFIISGSSVSVEHLELPLGDRFGKVLPVHIL